MTYVRQSKGATGTLPVTVTLDDAPTVGSLLVAVCLGPTGTTVAWSDDWSNPLGSSSPTGDIDGRLHRTIKDDPAEWTFEAEAGSDEVRIVLIELAQAGRPIGGYSGATSDPDLYMSSEAVYDEGEGVGWVLDRPVLGFGFTGSGTGPLTTLAGVTEIDSTEIEGGIAWVGFRVPHMTGVEPVASDAWVGATLDSPGTWHLELVALEAIGEWDVYSGADPNGPILATLERVSARKVQKALNGTGTGELTINRNDPQATAAIFKRGNVVKCRFPWRDDYDFAWIIEEGDFALLSPDEAGGEVLRFVGRGALAYLDRARMLNQAFTTGMDVSDTWSQVWESSGVLHPSGTWYDPDEDALNVIDMVTRRRYQIDQTTRLATAVSGTLFTGPAAGLSGDPSDSSVYWTLECPAITGGTGHTKIHKHDKATNAITDTFDLGSAIELTSIKCSGSFIWATRYDVSDGLYGYSMVDGSLLSTTTVVYDGVTQLHPTGVSFLGTSLLLWYEGTGRALKVSEATPSVVIGVITAADLPSLGADWSSEGGNEYLYPDSVTLGKTWKYQVTSATPHDPVDGIWRLDEPTPGAILNRVISECQAPGRPRQPLPDLTRVFDYDVDSAGNAWVAHDGTTEFDAQVLESVLSVALRLMPFDVVLQMSPRLRLGAWNTYGTDRTGSAFGSGVVRFERGVNLAEGLQRKMASRDLASWLLAKGDGGLFAAAEIDDLGYVQEGGLTTQLSDATALMGTAEAELARQRRISEALSFAPDWGDDELEGRYLPFTHYDVGDLVRLHTGDDEFDYDEEDVRVYTLSLAELDNGEWQPTLDVQEGLPVRAPSGGTTGGGSSSAGAGGGGVTTIAPQSITVRGLDDTGAELTLAVGRTLESADLQVWQKESGVIGVAITSREQGTKEADVLIIAAYRA